MCGIITIKRLDKKSPVKMLRKRYTFQKERGTEGFGYLALKEGVLTAYNRTEEEKDIITKLEAEKEADEIIFHHRQPTSTENYAEAAHPIRVSNDRLRYDYFIVHNGVIWDDEEYKAKHNAAGFEYNTTILYKTTANGRVVDKSIKWNDSEAFAIELAIDLDKEGDGINIEGSIAFVALKVDKQTQKAVSLYWGRNSGSPLLRQYIPQQYLVLSSEGVGDEVKEDILCEYDYEFKTLSERPYQVGKRWVAPTTAYDSGWDSARHEFLGTRREEDDIPLVVIPPDLQDEYIDLLEEREKLHDIMTKMLDQGKDTMLIEAEIANLDDDIAEMENAYNKLGVE